MKHLQSLTEIVNNVTRVVIIGDSYNNETTDNICKSFPDSYIYKVSHECSNKRVTNMNLTVSEAVKKMNDKSVDLLLINSDMTKEEVRMWMSKVRKGGIISSDSTQEQFENYFRKPTQPLEGGWFFIN